MKSLKNILLSDEILMNIFCKSEGSILFANMILKISNKNNYALNNSISFVLDIILNSNNASSFIKKYNKKSKEKIPTIDNKRIPFLISLEYILLKVPIDEENIVILEMLNNLLDNPENFKIFKVRFNLF